MEEEDILKDETELTLETPCLFTGLMKNGTVHNDNHSNRAMSPEVKNSCFDQRRRNPNCASDSSATMALYKFIYLLTYLLTYLRETKITRVCVIWLSGVLMLPGCRWHWSIV